MEPLNGGNICAGLELVRIEVDRPYYEMYYAQLRLQKKVKALPDPARTMMAAAHKAIYWQFCIADECFELLEWLETPKTEFTDKEMRMEAIDILHFVFNLGLELDVTADEIEAMFLAFPYKDVRAMRAQWNGSMTLIGAVVELQKSLTACIGRLPWKTWKAYTDLPGREEILQPAQLLYKAVLLNTITICCLLGMLPVDIVDYYFAKNNENHRRQDANY